MKKILFVCTHNRCRSILGQAITNYINDRRVIAESAGAHPAEQVHPLTLQYLEQRKISTTGLYSKSWDDLSTFDPHVVITVCDQAANEVCPAWLGEAAKVHWGLPDPSRIQHDQDTSLAFTQVIETFENRMRYVLCQDVEKMNTQQFSALLIKAAKKK